MPHLLYNIVPSSEERYFDLVRSGIEETKSDIYDLN